MCPGATEFTRIPRGPSSVARLCAIASRAALVSLYGPMVRCEKRTTMELIITTEPLLSASSGVNSLVSRSAATTFASKLGVDGVQAHLAEILDRRHRQRVVHQRVHPAERVRAASARCSAAAASARSVGTASPRRPSPVDLLGHVVEPGRGARGEHHVRPFPGAGQRDGAAEAGPTPATTTTLSRSIITEHPFRDGGLARGDPSPATRSGDTRALVVVRQPCRDLGERDHRDLRAVLLG